jgi:8-oxo-dGTP pyrophosphatase MutT (NUDIX family)
MPLRGRKILAILYVLLRKQGKKPRFLVVKDARDCEWTFISGTCESGEPYHKCAIREVREETRGLVSLKKLPKLTRKFQTAYQDKSVQVLFIPLRLTEEQMSQMSADFPEIETHGLPELEENTTLRFETLGQFMRRKHVWDFVKDLCQTDTFMDMCPK